MAINVSFNGATIWVPGAYSKSIIDLGGGFPLSPTGLVAIFGEADAGAPGSAEVEIANNVFSPDQMPAIRDKYRSGPIVDAASFLFSPATDGAIPSGAQAIYVYKTNASLRAQLVLASSYGTVKSREYGIGGNLITYKNVLIGEVPAVALSSATFNEASIVTGNKFDLYMNGGAPNTFTFPAITDNADLIAALAGAGNWSAGLPAGMTVVVGGIDGASTISFAMAAGSNLHRSGWGRSFELANKLGTPLATMKITPAMYSPALEPSSTMSIFSTRDLLKEEEALGGNIVMSIGYTGVGASASVSVNASSMILKLNGSPVFTLDKASYPTLGDMVRYINLQTGWASEVSVPLYGVLPPLALDYVSDIGALSAANKPARMKKDASDTLGFFSQSLQALIANQAMTGLADALIETALSGGAKGASQTVDMVTALEKFSKVRVNSVVPLFSRDAAEDILDGLTDSLSSYTLAGLHQAVKTHLSMMATTKKKSERQGYLSMKDSFDNCKAQSGIIADARSQLFIQDIRQSDAQGNIRWYQPWALACLLAGARGGSPIGTPMTFKRMNCSGIRQTGQPMRTAAEDIVGDFDPDTMADEAIQSGISFLEAPQTGGFRVVVDNTTYGRDGNWVYNRANVLYAADILAYDFRNQMENLYVGVKNTVKATEVASTADSILRTYLSQGITVSTADAPNGYHSLSVRLEGNIIYIDVTVKLVEGIDFILATITLQRAQSVA